MLRTAVCVCAVLVVRAQVDTTAPWPMAGGNNLRNGQSLFHGPISSPNSTVSVNWQFAPPRIFPNPAPAVMFAVSPAVAHNGDVWASSGAGTVYCINGVTGFQKFNSFLARNFAASPPTLGQGVVVVGSRGMNIWAVNSTFSDGKIGIQLWQFTTASTGYDLSSAAISAANIAFVGTGEGSVLAIKIATGSLLWSYSTKTNHRVTAPALDESSGVLYVTTSEGTLWAIAAATGALVWQQPLLGPSQSGPILTAPGGSIVLGTDIGVQAFNTAGTPIWSHPTTRPVSASPAFGTAAGIIYAAAWDSNVYALNAATGDLLWTFFAGGLALSVSPVVDASGTVFIGSNLAMWGISGVTGVPLWTINNMPSIVYSSAAIGNGTLYVGVAVGGTAPAGHIVSIGAVATQNVAVAAV